ncbi:unnamed protein product [Arctia plantaginis]|uniref:Roadblock/LAMTOR2 domain-containing protein n=1 Tax=Arctia plantaginis TaxID=874455 RepID=A0A8S1BN01_ARCPL|nr:unnamed protein product [Arctia plantaginis]
MSENTMCSENRIKYIELPEEFTTEIMEIISRIERRAAGVLYLKNGELRDKLGILRSVILHTNMKVMTNLLKDALDEHLVRTTAAINTSNPIVDRIMDDDSVEGVIMTNKEGAPIFTNVSVTHATLYARHLHKYGVMSMTYMTELDPLDEILVIRMQTKKNELILTPHRDFLIIIIQHSRKNTKVTNVSKR